jgi:hypothetical protein
MSQVSKIDEILREYSGEFAAQYRMRNEAKDPYSIKIAERKAEDAHKNAKQALLSIILEALPKDSTQIATWTHEYSKGVEDAEDSIRKVFGVEG